MLMAFQKGVAQIVHVATLDGAEPTAPTNPVVTVSEDNGATFGAPDNAATTTAYGIALTLSAAETNRDMVLVRVASDNCDTALAAFWFEADWTATKAGYLDASVAAANNGTPPSASTIAAAVWAEGTRTLTQSIGAITLTLGSTNIVDETLVLEVPRGDSYTLTATITDADGAAVDLSSYTAYKLTVKAPEYRGDTDDANKLFQVTGMLSGAGNNVLTFALTPTQTALGDLDVWYDCDVEVANADRSAVRTLLIGRYRSTLDVTRGS